MKFRFKVVALAAVALMLSVSFLAIIGNDRSEGAAESPSSVELSLYDIGEKDHSVTLYLGDTLTIKGYYHDGSNYGVYYSVSSVPSWMAKDDKNALHGTGAIGLANFIGDFTVSWVYDRYNSMGTDVSNHTYSISVKVLPVPQNVFSLSYDANGGSGEPGTQTYVDRVSSHTFVVSSSVPNAPDSDYIFLTWCRTADGTGEQIACGQEITVNAGETVVLYAIWHEKGVGVLHTFVLTYDANGGSAGPAVETAYSQSPSFDFVISNVKPSAPSLVYAFKEWNTSADGSGHSYGPKDKFTVECSDSAYASVTLYAIYDKTVSDPFREISGFLTDPIVTVGIIVLMFGVALLIRSRNGGF